MAIELQNTEFIDTFRKFFQGFHGARLKTLVLIIQAMAAVWLHYLSQGSCRIKNGCVPIEQLPKDTTLNS